MSVEDVARIGDLSAEDKRALLAELLQEKLAESKIAHPLSHGQRAMWFLYQLAPESAAYNVAFTARISSAVNVPALRRALQALVDRHAALRTTFTMRSGRPVQLVHEHASVCLEEFGSSSWTEEELFASVIRTYERPFDLERGPIFRATLFANSVTDYVLLLSAHHIVLDGWSVWILLDDFRTLYAAETGETTKELPALKLSYLDYVKGQTQMLAGGEGEHLWAYWQRQLAGELPTLNLPTDRPRPATQSFRGAAHDFALNEALVQRIKALARSQGATLYAVLLAAFHVLLHRCTAQEDILVGSPMAGRSRADLARIVGDFINMVVVRADLSGDPSFNAFLKRTQKTAMDALAHQDYPFSLLVERLSGYSDPSRSPVFQVIFDLQRVQGFEQLADLFVPEKTGARVDLGGLILEPFPMKQQLGQVDLALQMMEAKASILGNVKYNTDLFDADTIERMAGHFQNLLESIVADPDRRVSELPLLTENERYQILVEWNDTHVDFPPARSIHQLFENQAERTPDATAVTFDGRHLTYRELNQRSNQLAHYLRGIGVGPEVLVGLCLERSLDMFVGLLGILKAGGAYVPLDPEYPSKRLAFMLNDAKVTVLVTQASLLSRLPEPPATAVCLDADWTAIGRESGKNPIDQTNPQNLMYTIYTSGSTGQPKGVQIEHRSVINFLYAIRDQVGISESDILLAVTTLSFDIAVLEILLPLTVGAKVVLVSKEAAQDGSDLLLALTRSGSTMMQATPVTWRLLLDAGWQGDNHFKVLCGGEALPRDLADELLRRQAILWNLYGPTETTIWSSLHRIEADDVTISIGRPLASTQIYLLGHGLQPVPIGVSGELYIGGAGVARGYLGRPELTSERFIPNPFSKEPGARLYKTGDLARYLPNGNIECLGRLDDQVKLRGFRIELGEVESVLTEHPSVHSAVAVIRDDIRGGPLLLAYIVAVERAEINIRELRNFLRNKVPEFMVPSAFIFLDTLPLTPNGKVDRRALPAPPQIQSEPDESFGEPETPLEKQVAEVWQEILGVPKVGLYDNFFDLGGHSLQSVEALSLLQKRTGIKLNPAQIRLQTLGQLAATYEEQMKSAQAAQSGPRAKFADKLIGAIRRNRS